MVRKKVTKRVRPPFWTARPLSLAALERGTLAERVADAIRHRILLGDVRPGRRLESVRELARELEVSISVVREAIAQLKGEGLVEVRHGVGTFAARRPRAARALKAARRRASRREASELRQLVEPAIAAVAARRATSAAIRELHFALGERSRAALEGRPMAFVDADLALHLAVGQAARNGLGATAGRMAGILLRSELAARSRELAHDRRLNDLHYDLVDAIDRRRAHDAQRAARAIAAIEGRPP